jgi:serine/threonine-protein kinase
MTSIISTVRTGTEGTRSLVGSVMGTPEYMPPEQALGKVDLLDRRSDVFSLGAILCEILTGKTPYAREGPNDDDPVVQAASGRIEPALARLSACGADAEIVRVATACLVPAQAARPRDAGVVATAVTNYLTLLEERSKRAEVEAVEAAAHAEAARKKAEAAQALAAKEKKGRRLVQALGAAVVGALLLAAGGVWLLESGRHRRERDAAAAVEEALATASRLEGVARAASDDLEAWNAATAAARRADSTASTSGVSDALRARAAQALAAAEGGAAKAAERAGARRRDDEPLGRLEEIRFGRGAGVDFEPSRL